MTVYLRNYDVAHLGDRESVFDLVNDVFREAYRQNWPATHRVTFVNDHPVVQDRGPHLVHATTLGDLREDARRAYPGDYPSALWADLKGRLTEPVLRVRVDS
jgi:hypothetical protein